MKILISLGMVIIFLSAFFVFYTFDFMSRQYTSCITENSNTLSCNGPFHPHFIIPLSIMSLFIMISLLTAYTIIRNIKETEEM